MKKLQPVTCRRFEGEISERQNSVISLDLSLEIAR